MKNIFFTLFCCCFCNGIIWSQDHVEKNEPKQEPLFKNSLGEMKIKFDETGDKFLKFGVSSQVWFRSIENNPGTAVNGVSQDHTIDAGVRRVRITMQSQLSKGYSVFFQFGINNQSFISGGGSGTGANGQEIGRASCRERGWISAAAGATQAEAGQRKGVTQCSQ